MSAYKAEPVTRLQPKDPCPTCGTPLGIDVPSNCICYSLPPGVTCAPCGEAPIACPKCGFAPELGEEGYIDD